MEPTEKPVSAWSTAWMPVALLILMAGGYALFQSKFSMVAKAEDAVKHELIDGDSAKFRDVRTISDFEVCGEVNSKNKLGGYVGFTPFKVTLMTSIQHEPLVRFGIDSGLCREK